MCRPNCLWVAIACVFCSPQSSTAEIYGYKNCNASADCEPNLNVGTTNTESDVEAVFVPALMLSKWLYIHKHQPKHKQAGAKVALFPKQLIRKEEKQERKKGIT